MSVLKRIFSRAKRSIGVASSVPTEAVPFAEQARVAEEGADGDAASAIFARMRATGALDLEAYWRLGRALGRSGRFEEARDALEAARGLDASLGDVDADLGNVAALCGRLGDAERHYRAALARHPGHPGILANLGRLLWTRRERAAAKAAFAEALEHDPGWEPALKGFASLAIDEQDLGRLRRVLERAPDCAAAHAAHGAVLLRVAQDAPGALEQFDLALHGGDDDVDVHGGRGLALNALGRTQEALQEFDAALARDPHDGSWRWHRALALLALGRYAVGWVDYEIRLRSEDRPQRDFGLPRWTGGDLSAQTILVHAEQGLGDEIMFASCLPEIVARAHGCIIDCHPKLAGLYRRSFPGARIHAGTQFDDPGWLAALGPADCQVPVGSLPLYLRPSRAAFPDRDHYLVADPARVQRWRARLAGLGARDVIGLSWRGGSKDTGRERRSVSLERLRPLLARPGAHWISLQYDTAPREVEAFAQASGVRLSHWPEAIDDYEETAAMLCALDLTISVCTALVHLAGALGRPVWVAAPVAPEWRYGVRGVDMPWYGSVRLYRQSPGEDWEPVIARLGAALDKRRA
jgi:tetratricopeptide (TPR) repeat protein